MKEEKIPNKIKRTIYNGKQEIIEWMDNDGFIDNSDGIESIPILYYRKVPEEYADLVLNQLEDFLEENYNRLSRIEPSGECICFYYSKDEHYESIEDLIREKNIILKEEDDFNIADEIEMQM